MTGAASGYLLQVFATLEEAGDTVVLREIRGSTFASVSGDALLKQVSAARQFLRLEGVQPGDRCVLVGGNSIRWVAMDLAIMAEGAIAVPLYARQATSELAAMMQDCQPKLVVCGDDTLRQSIAQTWPGAPEMHLLDEVFAGSPGTFDPVTDGGEQAPVTIIYTSGTSGVAKGVVLTSGNVSHMLRCTAERLDVLMHGVRGQDRVFHYLPFCFAGSWILLLTCLLRGSLLTLNTDLNKLADDLRVVEADYFLNVPALLERMRRGIDDGVRQKGGIVYKIFTRAKATWFGAPEGKTPAGLWLSLAKRLIFPTVRRQVMGSNLKALICGSAPLAVETQRYYDMLGIRVLQVYGLTETTAICTMDHPHHVEAGRVGPAIPGVEMKLGENDEIIVRGANIFPGYWKRPEETAKVLREGWFYTGDQGEVNAEGNWKISGRIKNLVILSSGHNVPPEPIEDRALQHLPGALHAVVVGNGRGYLSLLVTGNVKAEIVRTALDTVNSVLPHYKQLRAFHVCTEPFTIDNGMLTANGKLKRDAINIRWKKEIDAMYQAKVGMAS
jgi:long-chain acyl-CoA synthetase